MADASSVSDRPCRGPWQFTLRGLFLSTFSVAVGLSLWKMSQNWYGGALAAISFWIVLGLAAQVRDIWTSSRRCESSTPEERWGRRFAIFWRVALCGLFGMCLLLLLLVRFHIVALNDGESWSFVSSRQMWWAVLLISIIAAVGSSPRLARPTRRHRWSWVVNLLAGVAALVLFAILLHENLCITFLVHVTIGGIMSAAPLWCARDAVETYSPARAAWFFDVSTAGAIAVFASCGLLRLLSLRWRREKWQRTCLVVLSAVSLGVTIVLAGRIALVEVPGISPVMAANVLVPTLSRLVPAMLLVLLLTTIVAGRWSRPLVGGTVPEIVAWRRDERRYYHERRLLMLFLGGVALAECAVIVYWSRMNDAWTEIWYAFGNVLTTAAGALSLTLAILAFQAMSLSWSKCPDPVATESTRLSPGLFLLLWTALLAIVLCSAPIFAAWGFALWLK